MSANETEVLLPQFGMGMKDGQIARWLKKEGDRVVAGEIICEIETAKATAEVEAPASGVLLKIVVPEQGTAEVREVIGVIGTASTDAAPATAVPSVAPEASVKPARPDSPQTPVVSAPSAGTTVQIEPRARRAAEQAKISIAQIQGTGPNGRITEADVQREATRRAAEVCGPAGSPEAPSVPHSATRVQIAERVLASKRNVPHFYVTAHVRIDRLLQLRDKLRSEQESSVSITDCLVRACALALQAVPEANISWTDSAMRQFRTANVGVAVAGERGVVTVTIRDAQSKSLPTISRELRPLVGRAREGKLRSEDLAAAASMTVSNLGMFGVAEFVAIIDEPQACILAVGAGERRPVAAGGAIEIGTMMTCTLSADHRALDGALAGRLLGEIKALIEDPERLV